MVLQLGQQILLGALFFDGHQRGFAVGNLGGMHHFGVRQGLFLALYGHGVGSLLQLFHHRIRLFEHREYLRIIIGKPELQRSSSLEELAHTLRLLHTGKLHEDTPRRPDLLDIRLRHAETVDTAAQDVERVVDGTLGLLPQHADHLFVGAGGGDLLAQLLRVEDQRQRSVARQVGVRTREERDEILGTVLLLAPGLRKGRIEDGVLAIVGQRPHHILDGDFEHDVHTALQVETEVDLPLLYLFVGETQEYFLGLDRVEIGLLLILLEFGGELFGIASRFPLDVSCHERERKLVSTCDRQNNRNGFDCASVLHCV